MPIPESADLAATMDRGYVVVPQSRTGEPGRELKLVYTRLSTRVGSGASPVFMLAGGPGETNMPAGRFDQLRPELLGPILDTRDIVYVEQRGTRVADPFLDCPAVYSLPYTA